MSPEHPILTFSDIVQWLLSQSGRKARIIEAACALQAFKSKLDEESRANVYKIIDTGKHAAKLMCNPETSQPLGGSAALRHDDTNTDLKQMQFPYATWNGVQHLDPYARVEASQLAAEAIAQNAATAPQDASAGIADILKGRGGEGGPPQLSNASSTYQHVTAEALQGHKTVAAEQGAPAFLRRAFSLCERDDADVDLQHLNTLQKVLLPLNPFTLPPPQHPFGTGAWLHAQRACVQSEASASRDSQSHVQTLHMLLQ